MRERPRQDEGKRRPEHDGQADADASDEHGIAEVCGGRVADALRVTDAFFHDLLRVGDERGTGGGATRADLFDGRHRRPQRLGCFVIAVVGGNDRRENVAVVLVRQQAVDVFDACLDLVVPGRDVVDAVGIPSRGGLERGDPHLVDLVAERADVVALLQPDAQHVRRLIGNDFLVHLLALCLDQRTDVGHQDRSLRVESVFGIAAKLDRVGGLVEQALVFLFMPAAKGDRLLEPDQVREPLDQIVGLLELLLECLELRLRPLAVGVVAGEREAPPG